VVQHYIRIAERAECPPQATGAARQVAQGRWRNDGAEEVESGFQTTRGNSGVVDGLYIPRFDGRAHAVAQACYKAFDVGGGSGSGASPHASNDTALPGAFPMGKR